MNKSINITDREITVETVAKRHDREIEAEDVASWIRGVVTIENKLKVDESWRWKSDEEIRQDIEERFRRSSVIEANQTVVTVQDGIATLSGTVEICQKHNFVVDQALKGGAKSVFSRLTISYGATEHEEEAPQ